MRYTILAGLAALVLALGACQSTTPQTELAIGCQGYASTLAGLATVKGELDSDQVATVNEVRTIVNPICTDIGAVDNTQSALATLRAQMRALNRVNTEVEVNQ